MSAVFNLKINILYGESVNIEIGEESTISQLMKKIMEITGIHMEEQRLIFLGHVLDKEKSLKDYNIQDGNCIQLVKQVC